MPYEKPVGPHARGLSGLYPPRRRGSLLDRDETLDWERMHMASSARLAYLMAQERGVDPDLAACACRHPRHRPGAHRPAGRPRRGRARNPPGPSCGRPGSSPRAGDRSCWPQAVRQPQRQIRGGPPPLRRSSRTATWWTAIQYGLPFARPEQERRYQSWLAGPGRERGTRDESTEGLFYPHHHQRHGALKNRIVMPAMHHLLHRQRLLHPPRFPTITCRRAEGGAGSIIVGSCRLRRLRGQGQLHVPALSDDTIPGWKQFTDGIHQRGSKAAVQLYHAGRYMPSKKDVPCGGPALAPSGGLLPLHQGDRRRR